MSLQPKDFQQKTAKRITDLFISGRNRVLLADEVGLGKTVVARSVIDLYRQYRSGFDDFYKVVYICSNASISHQNIKDLNVNNSADFSESRLSMQHLYIAREEQKIINDTQIGAMPERLIPLTPTTSFHINKSTGTYKERALLCVILPYIIDIEDNRYWKKFMQMDIIDANWNYEIEHYKKIIEDLQQTNYLPNLRTSFHQKLENASYSNLISAIHHVCSTSDTSLRNIIIPQLRNIFAQISMDMLDPDLVIMDEFQRFSDLLHPGDDEQSMLVRQFFNNSETKILLLSATPYKPYSTIEEVNEGYVDAYRDFLQVMDFLFVKQDERGEFHTIWKNFSNDLRNVSNLNLKNVIESKSLAEDKLYNVTCRTERLTNNMDPNAKTVFDVDCKEGDILSFAQGQYALDTITKHTRNVCFRKIPMEYVMSAPYLLSFMKNYQLHNYWVNNIRFFREQLQKRGSLLCLSEQRINNYEYIAANNGKLQFLHDKIFGTLNSKGEPTHHIHQLLWVPASRPYYKAGGIFEEEASKRFSKLLIFSSWEMVPRMLSIMLSYYAECYTIGRSQYRKLRHGFSYKTSQKSKTPRVTERTDEFFLEYPCQWLAQVFAPMQYLDWHINDIRKEIREKIKMQLIQIGIVDFNGKEDKPDAVLEIMKLLDGKSNKEFTSIHPNVLSILVDCAIASPAICTYRLDKDIESAKLVGESFIKLFNKPENAAIWDTMFDDEPLYRKVLDYCVIGNVQAMLDEYKFTLKGAKLGDNIIIASSTNLDLVTKERVGDKNLFSMRTHFAMQYVDKVKTDGNIARTTKMIDVFNSPFRPFVMATTSVGQEGLNFHWYARKLVHWNLPSNPVDMEQREGRINRYACHAIRQSIAQLFGDSIHLQNYNDNTIWQRLFEVAREQLGSGHSQMIPYWSLPINELTDDQKQKIVYIERIVPMYPYSSEHTKYEHLIKVLSLYRLTLGQPRQEELTQLLASNQLSKEELEQLMINLCPYKKEK